MVAMKPVGSAIRTVSFPSRRNTGRRSEAGVNHQSTSPRCNAAATVPPSGMMRHSTRSKCATFGPAVPLGAPA